MRLPYLIGHPYTVDKPLSDVRIMAATAGCTLDTAETDNIVRNLLYTYNARYDTISCSGNLTPWKGYWISTLESAKGTDSLFLIPQP